MNRARLAGATLLIAVTAVATLSGCTTPATPVESAPAGDNRPTTATTQVVDAPSASAAAPSAGGGTATLGKAYTWADGLSVTIGAPQSYTPSSSAAGVVDGQKSVTLQVTIVNGTGAPFDPAMATVSAQSGNTEASKIYDSAKGIGSSPSTKILAGRETTYKVAFSVADPKDLVVEFAPDFTYTSVIFTS